MSPLSHDQGMWVFDQHNNHHDANKTDTTQRAQHVFGHKEVSSDGQSETLVFQKLNHRGYDPSTFEISQVDVNDDTTTTRVRGLCGMGAGPAGGWPTVARKVFKRVFCRDEKARQPHLASSTFDSMLDSFHDGSTAKCSNAYYKATCSSSSSSSSGYSTDSSTDSESEMLRAENRRWRRGF